MPAVDREPKALITLANITVRVRDRHILPQTHWEIKSDQNWAVLGPNGSGKSSLARVLCGDLPYVAGRIIRHSARAAAARIGYVSFESQARLLARENDRDEARAFAGRWHAYATVRQRIAPRHAHDGQTGGRIESLADQMGIRHLLERGVGCLSNGEMRQVLIAKALIPNPGLLILDEPFDGLDRSSQSQLRQTVRELIDQGVGIILITHRMHEIMPAISHILCLKDCRVLCQGPRHAILNSQRAKTLYDRPMPIQCDNSEAFQPNIRKQPATDPPIIQMKRVSVAYNGVKVLQDLDWTVKRGQNWAVTGPNGSGKTTLLHLITGDHLQAYANEIYLFGKRRGSGETIWDLKKHIGVVSSELQIRYRKSLSGYDVVLSGFFDSVGLYRRADDMQKRQASVIIQELGITGLASQPFDQLSYGQRRMILLARAMVKTPQLLILDEPCQGLDRANRRMILERIDHISANPATQFLYVTHYEDEMPRRITHRLRLQKRGPSA